ncbi:hypothetical protein DM02DRAFT_702928 [Periconia macrospinosa]|uniref:G-protein coupled receptors family 1 profile domain-containing protein n=1 Tax=Periconia macrospinosa TaxID=97972 RepID=A0A2V1D143_9PLEO|nr:hypothetical protein DM02DRAFT_702928 [Periconia macrospinosa]
MYFSRNKDHMGSLRTTIVARNDSRIALNPETGELFVKGEEPDNGTIFAVVSMFCAITLSYLLGSRARALRNNAIHRGRFTSILIIWLFVFGLGFVICTAVVASGQGLRTERLCYSAIIICILFYTGNKLAIYIFLLERARIVRAPFVPRRKDGVWIVSIVLICVGFGSITMLAYLTPVVELSRLDGRCRMGVPAKVSLPLMCFDVVINFLLTGIFLWLMKPVLASRQILSLRSLLGDTIGGGSKRWFGELGGLGRGNDLQYSIVQKNVMNKHIKTLLLKSLVGSMLIMLPTVGNMIQFYVIRGREPGYICLMLCTLDVTWGCVVVNWLTIGSAEAEKDLTTLMTQTAPPCPRTEPHPIIPVPSPRSSVGEMYQPAQLQDAGRLLTADKGVTPVKRYTPY